MGEELEMTEPYRQELFYDGGGLEEGDLPPEAYLIVDIEALDGGIQFVRQGASPTIGVLASGPSTRKVTAHMFEAYKTTPLEVFEFFSPRGVVPDELIRDHRFWAQRQFRSSRDRSRLPSVDALIAGSEGALGPGSDCVQVSGGNCWEHFVDSAACGDDDLSLFRFWFQDYNKYAAYGANGISGSGEHEGPVGPGFTAVTLGPSSRGLLVACGHGSTPHYTIRWQVWVQGLGWKLIHVFDTAISFAHGYRYRGFSIHHMRMTITAGDGVRPRFFWGASY